MAKPTRKRAAFGLQRRSGERAGPRFLLQRPAVRFQVIRMHCGMALGRIARGPTPHFKVFRAPGAALLAP